MIGGRTRVAAVIGDPIEHTRSPQLHAAAFAAAGLDAVMVPLRVRAAELPAAVAGLGALGFLGASVTLPHKQAVARLCDHLEPLAEDCGAVNCLCFANGAVVGHNTDALGFIDGLRRAGFEPAGLHTVLLGCGGAARAIRVGLRAAGAASVALIARTPSRARWADDVSPFTAEVLADRLSRCSLLVDCTSAGLHGEAFPAPVPLERLRKSAVVASLLYGEQPALLAAAEARGLQTVDGTGMLVHQGARAFELWTGRRAPIDAMWAAVTAG